ncbi:ADC synthase [Pyronema domesticum]|nr:ADC synthase [Pyronema domesticum]
MIPKILLIDAYDSFSHNLSAQVKLITKAEVHTIHIDSPYSSISGLLPYLPSFTAIVVGPGPGHPSIPTDVGILPEIWRLADEFLLPVFGVCLGLQSLCLAFGGKVERLSTVKHGLTAEVDYNADSDLFEGVGDLTVVRYHSLHATLGEDMEALAWCTDSENGRVLMAAKHTQKPFWAVQYHPESICTEGSDVIVANFWKLAQRWNKENGRELKEIPEGWGIRERERSLLEQVDAPVVTGKGEVQTVELFTRGLDVGRICEVLGVESQKEFVLLESAAAPGRWSIIGVITPGITQLFRYTVGDSYLSLSVVGKEGSTKEQLTEPYNSSVWKYLASYIDTRKAVGGREESPFWGGLVGYFSYEMGVESLEVPLLRTRNRRPDVNLAFTERSICFDHHTGQVLIQSLIPLDSEWLESTKVLLQQTHDISLTPSTTPPPPGEQPMGKPRKQPAPINPTITLPDRQRYMDLVRKSQTYLASGDSYELCFTGRTLVSLSAPYPSAWSLYSSLRLRNPAPYAGFLALQGVTVLSSSPERFLSYSRSGKVQLRPIKGTVKKTPDMTRQKAEAILNTPKERAENLMILDLIRHDLHRILGAGNVEVTQLMKVEEYKSVFQLVSVIEGTIQNDTAADAPTAPLTGLDILSTSLPPGSMTGAPKKRSVDILQHLEKEDEERGVYSGVMGYMSVCGAGDWNVIIRSAYRYDEEGMGRWWLGAGGAVTALSTPEGEEEEMRVKLESGLGAFVG